MVLVVEANNTREQELREEATNSFQIKRQKAETVDANVQRTFPSDWELLRVNKRLGRLNNRSNTTSEKTNVTEEDIAAKTALGKLKLAQESLRKALQSKRKCFAALTPFEEVPADVVENCKEPTTEDIDGMSETVLKRTRPSRDKDYNEAENEDEKEEKDKHTVKSD